MQEDFIFNAIYFKISQNTSLVNRSAHVCLNRDDINMCLLHSTRLNFALQFF